MKVRFATTSQRPPRVVDLFIPGCGIVFFFLAPPSVNRLFILAAALALWFLCAALHALRHWSRYTPAGRRSIFKRVVATATVVILFGLLFVADRFLAARFENVTGLPFLGNNAPGLELHTLEPYPYSGFHVRPNVQMKGRMAFDGTEAQEEFDIRSGDHGFFVDFDLDNPPPKVPDEFRIILTGGSAAQGIGGRTNEDMLYRVLERLLNEKLSSTPIRVRVVNLAMANAISYQNFIMLNRWGHRLDPDLILSFSGANDVENPIETGCDMPLRFEGIWGLTRATWVTENSPLIDDLIAPFPTLNASLPFTALRTLRAPVLAAEGRGEYARLFQFDGAPESGNLALELFVHAIGSIKRDFGGVPIAVALQPVSNFARGRRHEQTYQEWFEMAIVRLRNHVNDDWLFANVHRHFDDNGYFDGSWIRRDGVHLTDEGHRAAAEFLASSLAPAVSALVAERAPAGKIAP